MPHIHPTTSPKGGNTSSSYAAINYLEKENKEKDWLTRQYFFNAHEDRSLPNRAVEIIDHSRQGLKKTDAKFFSVTYSFSQDELKGRTDRELKEFVVGNFSSDYATAVKGRDIDPSTIQYVAKLEYNRAYKGKDLEVKEGRVKQGDLKPGDNRHIHVLVARNTSENKKISPLTNHRNSSKGAVKSGFDRIGFKDQTEKSFDDFFRYERSLNETYSYLRSDNKEEIHKKLNNELNE